MFGNLAPKVTTKTVSKGISSSYNVNFTVNSGFSNGIVYLKSARSGTNVLTIRNFSFNGYTLNCEAFGQGSDTMYFEFVQVL